MPKRFGFPKLPCSRWCLTRNWKRRRSRRGKDSKRIYRSPSEDDAGQEIIPVGSEVKGKVEDVDERHLTLKFKEIKTPSGKKSIEARLIGVDAENVKVDDNEMESPGKSGVKKVGSAGTKVVGIAKGGVAGAAVKGVGRILFGGGGKELKLKKGTQLKIELRKDLKFKLKDG